MSSILTNSSAMVALQTLNMVNKGLNDTQNRVSTGLQVSSGKDNAAYFAISSTMEGDSSMYKAVNEGLTSTKNSIATARTGAEKVQDYAQQFVERVAFAQANGVDLAEVQSELDDLVGNIRSTIDQSTFNGDNLVDGDGAVTVVTGITRTAGTGSDFGTTSISFDEVDLETIHTNLAAINLNSFDPDTLDDGDNNPFNLDEALRLAEGELANAISASTSLGVAEKTIEDQQEFLGMLTDTIDTGISGMIDADMEEEAARLQAYQVQQQLATQSLSMANQAPQNILSLFR